LKRFRKKKKKQTKQIGISDGGRTRMATSEPVGMIVGLDCTEQLVATASSATLACAAFSVSKLGRNGEIDAVAVPEMLVKENRQRLDYRLQGDTHRHRLARQHAGETVIQTKCVPRSRPPTQRYSRTAICRHTHAFCGRPLTTGACCSTQRPAAASLAATAATAPLAVLLAEGKFSQIFGAEIRKK
jgi:hypothetical protein